MKSTAADRFGEPELRDLQMQGCMQDDVRRGEEGHRESILVAIAPRTGASHMPDHLACPSQPAPTACSVYTVYTVYTASTRSALPTPNTPGFPSPKTPSSPSFRRSPCHSLPCSPKRISPVCIALPHSQSPSRPPPTPPGSAPHFPLHPITPKTPTRLLDQVGTILLLLQHPIAEFCPQSLPFFPQSTELRNIP
jgi:hypothetical protein